MNNFVILNDKIITSRYVLDMMEFIQKAENNEESKKVLYDEFSKLVLQGLITFSYTYTDNEENRLRGRVGKFSGFRHGTQYLGLIPDNKRPKSRSSEPTCLRYYDMGRMSWRSFKKNLFVVATSFLDKRDGKWKDNPINAGFKSNWNEIRYMNNGFKRKERSDTKEEKLIREKINKKELDKRNRQIKNTLLKSDNEDDLIKGKKALLGEERKWKDGTYEKTINGWVKKTDSKIQNLINDTLNTLSLKYYFDLNKVNIRYVELNKVRAYVSRSLIEDENGKFFKDGKKFGRSSESYDLVISKNLLNKTEKVIKATITHEFAHLLQLLWFDKDVYDKFKKSTKSVTFTKYVDNLLEIQAEAFTINELGYSNYSSLNDKNNNEYKEVLNEMYKHSPFNNDIEKSKKTFEIQKGKIKIN